MKNPILMSLALLMYFTPEAQILTATFTQDSAGNYKADFKGSEGIIIAPGDYTVSDALHDCDSVNQIRIKRLSLAIHNYEFNVIPGLKKEIVNLKMRRKKN